MDLVQLVQFMKFSTLANFETYVARLEKIPRVVEQVQDCLQKGVDSKMVMHRYSVEEIPSQLEEMISTPVEKHPFMLPFTAEDKKVSDDDLQKVKTKAMEVVTSRIAPAFQKLKDFMENVYLKNVRESEGITSIPGGKEYYQQCLNFHLSCEMTPEEVYDIGMKEIDRINKLMKDLAHSEGFDDLYEYIKHVNSQEDGVFSSSDEVLDYVRDLCFTKIRPKLPALFENMPESTFRVLPVPPVLANSCAGVYFLGTPDGERSGIYYLNTSNLKAVMKHKLMALSLHEAEPGHHLQGEYSLKEKNLPDFQRYSEDVKDYLSPHRFTLNTAFVEGWGLYAEALGEEMGMYEDKSTLLGRYIAEMFRAARLVVDTGMHAFGWSQERAIKFLEDHTKAEHKSVVNEINRYITWPGQACSYKIGEIKLWELRRKAERELGEKFKLAEFHEKIMKCGPVPLRFLEQVINDYIHAKLGHAAGNNRN